VASSWNSGSGEQPFGFGGGQVDQQAFGQPRRRGGALEPLGMALPMLGKSASKLPASCLYFAH